MKIKKILIMPLIATILATGAANIAGASVDTDQWSDIRGQLTFFGENPDMSRLIQPIVTKSPILNGSQPFIKVIEAVYSASYKRIYEQGSGIKEGVIIRLADSMKRANADCFSDFVSRGSVLCLWLEKKTSFLERILVFFI